MKFEEKLRKQTPEQLWQEYCGFLDLSMDAYMRIQQHLLMEQVQLLSASRLGRGLLGNNIPGSIEEFRATVPLTTYEDYADTLLMRREEDLPAKPLVWLETTWEGGDYPRKTAPYSLSMLNTYRHNLLGALLPGEGPVFCAAARQGALRAGASALRDRPVSGTDEERAGHAVHPAAEGGRGPALQPADVTRL